MSAHARPLRPAFGSRSSSIARLRAIVTSARLHRVALAGLILAMLVLTWRSWGRLEADVGYDLSAGARTATGSLPYVDYDYAYGPLAPFLLGGLFKLFGASLGVAAVLGTVLAAAIVGLTYVLGSRAAGAAGGLLVGALLVAGGIGTGGGGPIFNLILPHSYAAVLATTFVAVTLVALVRLSTTAGTGSAWLAGVGLAGVAVARPESLMAIALATALLLVVRRDRRESLAVLAPLAIVAGLVYGPFAVSVGVHNLIWRDLYPVDVLNAGGAHVLRTVAPLTAGSLIEVVLRGAALLGVAIAVAAVGAAIARGGRARLIGFGLLAAAAACLPLLVITRGGNVTLHDLVGLAFRGLPVIAIGLLAYDLWRLRRGRREPRVQADLVLSAFVAVACLRTYGLFLPGSDALYVLGPACALLARLHLREVARWPGARVAGIVWLVAVVTLVGGLSIRAAHRKTMTVHAAYGTFRDTPADGVPLQAAVDAIRSRTAPGEAILVAPQLEALPFLTGRSALLRVIDLLPGTLHDANGERRAIQVLERRGVRLAVIDQRPLTEYGQGRFGATYDQVIAAWVRTHFSLVQRVSGPGAGLTFEIWQRGRS